MTTDETQKLIALHATDGNTKHGMLTDTDDVLARLARLMEKLRAAHNDQDRTDACTTFTRRTAQIAGICFNWMQESAALYEDVALTVPKLADMATQDPAADPQDVKP